MLLSNRSAPGAPRPTACKRAVITPRAYLGAAEAPDNVKAARLWIARWKARQGQFAPLHVVPSSTTSTRATAAAVDAPTNVKEAREWIANWKVRSQQAAAPQLSSGTPNAEHNGSSVADLPQPAVGSAAVPDNVAEARAWIAAWKQRTAAAATAPPPPAAAAPPSPPQPKKLAAVELGDGTLVFSSELLASKSYTDLMGKAK